MQERCTTSGAVSLVATTKYDARTRICKLLLPHQAGADDLRVPVHVLPVCSSSTSNHLYQALELSPSLRGLSPPDKECWGSWLGSCHARTPLHHPPSAACPPPWQGHRRLGGVGVGRRIQFGDNDDASTSALPHTYSRQTLARAMSLPMCGCAVLATCGVARPRWFLLLRRALERCRCWHSSDS